MSAPKARDQRAAMRRMRDEAQALDLRRQKQIGNQVATINRLLDDPDAAKEIELLHQKLAEAEAARDELLSGMADALKAQAR